MNSELKKVIQEGRNLIKRVHYQDDPKRKILLNRAEMGLKTFETTMKQLILDT